MCHKYPLQSNNTHYYTAADVAVNLKPRTVIAVVIAMANNQLQDRRGRPGAWSFLLRQTVGPHESVIFNQALTPRTRNSHASPLNNSPSCRPAVSGTVRGGGQSGRPTGNQQWPSPSRPTTFLRHRHCLPAHPPATRSLASDRWALTKLWRTTERLGCSGQPWRHDGWYTARHVYGSDVSRVPRL